MYWQITSDTDVEQQLNHSIIVDSFMDEYGGRVESAEKVFADDSMYTTIVKVICVCMRVSVQFIRTSVNTMLHVCTQESVAFYQRKGLGELPQVLVNGVTLDSEEVARSAYHYTLMLTPLT